MPRLPRSLPAPPLRKGPRRTPSVLGILGSWSLMLAGAGLLAAALFELLDGGSEELALGVVGAGSVIVGFVGWRRFEAPARARPHTAFIAVTGCWVLVSLVSMIAYLAAGTFDRVDDALFESISGFTTTGASVLAPIEGTSRGVLLWRSLTQWLGGMGFIVLIVSFIPLNRAGPGIFDAEAPGSGVEKITPRLRHTAVTLWQLYLGFTIAIGLAYGIAGMTTFDSVNHALTTMSTGGFSTRDASFAAFDAGPLQWIGIVGMYFAGVNFVLFVRVLRGQPLALFDSVEFRLYSAVIVVITTLALISNHDTTGTDADTIRETLFTVTSLATSTGFTLLDYDQWSAVLVGLLVIVMSVGAMAGSTSGGYKLARVITLFSYARREVARLLHPRLVRPVRIGSTPISERVVDLELSFTILFGLIIGVTTLLLAASGEDLATSVSAGASSIGNIGPGLGDIGPTQSFLGLNAWGRAVTMVVMLMGRLEVFPVMVAGAALARTTRRELARLRPSG